MRFFNTDGPVVPEMHYMIPPLDRVDLDEILRLIRWQKYIVLYAPRQTGKTSVLLELVDYLNRSGECRCVYASCEVTKAAGGDIARAMAALLSELASRAVEFLNDDFVERVVSASAASDRPYVGLAGVLSRWSASSSKPLVLLLDEIDSLAGDTLISVLRQLRSRFDMRPDHFPQSVVLCGVRDVRDYRMGTSKGEGVLGSAVFNIKARSLRLGDFTENEVRSLLGQHRAETGQVFTAKALAAVWRLTRGQPGLVNALAYECCRKRQAVLGCARAIDAAEVEDAGEALIQNRVPHLDHLAGKLREGRVRRVIEPVLAGTMLPGDLTADELDYSVELGLIRIDVGVEVANPIYREMIPRALTNATERRIVQRSAPYVDATGNLDLAGLLGAFQAYFHEHSEQWMERFSYKEAGPHLLLQAFLQRIVSGGGRIEREYAAGQGCTNLLLQWPKRGDRHPARVCNHAIESKVVSQSMGLDHTVREGLRQTSRYMARCGAESGHLVVFDRRHGRSREDRVFRREERAGSKQVTVWGM